MESIGKKIQKSRKLKGVTSADLAKLVGVSTSTMSYIEQDYYKGGPSPDHVIRIADALEDDSILIHYIETNPVYQRILPRIFPELNNIRRDPAVIFTRISREAAECTEAADNLAEMFSNADPHRLPGFADKFKKYMEQIVDIKRGVEILEFELLATSIIDREWLTSLYQLQQQKCIARGHHKPENSDEERAA